MRSFGSFIVHTLACTFLAMLYVNVCLAEEGSAFVDPCPPAETIPQQAVSIDDLAKMQADIERFNLCLERAQLVQKLNDATQKNLEALQKFFASAPLLEQNAPVSRQSLSLGAFKAPEPPDLPPTQESGEEEGTSVEEPPKERWLVFEISGSSGNFRAKLGKPDGTIKVVGAGETLPDGTLVTSVSPSGVIVRGDQGVSETLEWLR